MVKCCALTSQGMFKLILCCEFIQVYAAKHTGGDWFVSFLVSCIPRYAGESKEIRAEGEGGRARFLGRFEAESFRGK